jgi:hypothetical protein
LSPHTDQFNEADELAQEVFIPFDEAGEARWPRRAPDEPETDDANECI